MDKIQSIDLPTSGDLDLGIDGYTYTLVESIDDIKEVWKDTTKSSTNLYNSYPYLKAMEVVPPSGLCYMYIVTYHSGKVVGVYYFQYKRISLKESLSLKVQNACSLKGMKDGIKMGIAQLLDVNVLVCGNVSLTGNNGNYILEPLSKEKQGVLLEKVADKATQYLKNDGVKVSAILVKDFYPDNCPILTHGYTRFSVQPNMVLPNIDRWETTDQYLDSIKSKYRVRYKKARKSIQGITKKALSVEELIHYKDEMHEMYKKISNSASFNLFILPDNYFSNLKSRLPDDFHVIGYFDGEKMCAFYTYVLHGDEVDAHFLGYDGRLNKSHKLYLNTLYDMVEIAIANSKKRLVLSRTAMEIKSTVGAEGIDMLLYFKVLNPLMNGFFRAAFNYFNPTERFTLRSPFKD